MFLGMAIEDTVIKLTVVRVSSCCNETNIFKNNIKFLLIIQLLNDFNLQNLTTEFYHAHTQKTINFERIPNSPSVLPREQIKISQRSTLSRPNYLSSVIVVE
jgi:hypothetical protein